MKSAYCRVRKSDVRPRAAPEPERPTNSQNPTDSLSHRSSHDPVRTLGPTTLDLVGVLANAQHDPGFVRLGGPLSEKLW